MARWFIDVFIGGFGRFLVALVLSNWVVIVSALFAAGATFWAYVTQMGYLKAALAGGAAFGLVLWILIGVVWFYRLGTPVVVIQTTDYSYTLAYQSVFLAVSPNDETATVQIGIRFMNVSRGPIQYKMTEMRVVVEDRTLPNATFFNAGGIIPSATVREYRYPAFSKKAMADSLGRKVEGSVEFTVEYGPPNAAPVRRLHMKLLTTLDLGNNPGIVDVIAEEGELTIATDE
jgi:hypothetical protein